jgi:hypothetical protein
MRLASFNLENIFDRAKALNQDTMEAGKEILDEFARLNKLLSKPTYTPTDKKKILEGLKDLGVLKKDDAGEFVLLRQNRGKLLKRPQNGPVEVVAGGRDEWIGWLELRRQEDVVDFLRRCPVAEGPRSAVALEVLVDAHIT